MASKRIGHIDASGNPVYPAETISGRPLAASGNQIHMLSGGEPGRFVIFDIFAPPDFDLAGELARLQPGAPVLVEAVDDLTGKTVVVPVTADTPLAEKKAK